MFNFLIHLVSFTSSPLPIRHQVCRTGSQEPVTSIIAFATSTYANDCYIVSFIGDSTGRMALISKAHLPCQDPTLVQSASTHEVTPLLPVPLINMRTRAKPVRIASRPSFSGDGTTATRDPATLMCKYDVTGSLNSRAKLDPSGPTRAKYISSRMKVKNNNKCESRSKKFPKMVMQVHCIQVSGPSP